MDEQGPAPRQAIDIDALKGFLDSLKSYSRDLIQHLDSGQKLCHYTSLEGSVGIISGGDLWLSNSRFSNDGAEQIFGHQLVDEVLDELESGATGDVRRRDWRSLRAQIAVGNREQVYVCCFCEKENLLSQWRGYAKDGRGVSIEFDPDRFPELAACKHGLMRLWKVFYDRERQRDIIRACINYPCWPSANQDDQIRFIVDALRFFMPTFKDADFREEQERRLIFTPSPRTSVRPRFRTKGAVLVPYFSLKDLLDPTFTLPIKSVLLGPGFHRTLNVESTRMMLWTHEYVDVVVEASPTPYRG